MARRKHQTVEEFILHLKSDPVWVAKNRAMEEELEKKSARLHAEERPIIEDLRKAGFKVKSLQEMHDRMTGKINTPAGALPILFEHLDRPYSHDVRHSLALRFAVAAARPYWSELKRRFVEEDNDNVKQGFGNALRTIALSDKSLLPEVIELLRNRAIGHVRTFLVEILTRFSRVPEAERALQELKNEPDLKVEIGHRLHQRELRQRRKARKGKPRR